jgi:hypothetical protein
MAVRNVAARHWRLKLPGQSFSHTAADPGLIVFRQHAAGDRTDGVSSL